MMETCYKCQANLEAERLLCCPICLRYVCRDCTVKAFGQQFCSSHCRDYYLSAEEDYYDEDWQESWQ